MNNKRRRDLSNVIDELNLVTNKDDLAMCISMLEDLKSEEEDFYDNAPENLQYSMRYEMSQEAIDNMEEALNCLEQAEDCDDGDEFQGLIEDAISYIEDASF